VGLGPVGLGPVGPGPVGPGPAALTREGRAAAALVVRAGAAPGMAPALAMEARAARAAGANHPAIRT
jgi:hypothetical protein